MKSNKILCAFNGQKGAYAEIACEKYFKQNFEAISVGSFKEIFQSVIDGKVDYGMVPIENTTAGSVYQNYDNFALFENVSVVGAIALKVQHALLAPHGASLETIKNVYSHPQALYQSASFLSQHKDWHQVETVSTSDGAKLVSEKGSIENACICNEKNADIYNLKVLKLGTQDNNNNYTRFVLIAPLRDSKIIDPLSLLNRKPNKASFVFTTKNQPGSLYDVLGVFKDMGLNLIHLESRPISGIPWSYRFFASVELPIFDDEDTIYSNIKIFLDKCKVHAQEFRLLGLYQE